MTHFRAQIRAEIKARLEGMPGLTTPVLDSRDIPSNQQDVPLAWVSYGIERRGEVDKGDDGRVVSLRELSITVGFCSTDSEACDDVSAEIESRLAAPLIDGVEHFLESTQFEDPQRGEWDFFSVSLTYTILYVLVDGVPDRSAG